MSTSKSAAKADSQKDLSPRVLASHHPKALSEAGISDSEAEAAMSWLFEQKITQSPMAESDAVASHKPPRKTAIKAARR